jgi:phosphoserine aminotransferase
MSDASLPHCEVCGEPEYACECEEFSKGNTNMTTLGEQRVRRSFNPENSALVEEIKSRTAELLNLCEMYRISMGPGEAVRCWAIAMERYEDAAMWAVKGATHVATS